MKNIHNTSPLKVSFRLSKQRANRIFWRWSGAGFFSLLGVLAWFASAGAQVGTNSAPGAGRAMERLNRGLVAMPVGNGAIYVGWRQLATDPSTVAFVLYRKANGGAAQRLTREPIAKTTDYMDAKPPQGKLEYFVRPVVRGREAAPAETVTVDTGGPVRPYRTIKLEGDYRFQKVAMADLDGDGRLDFVIKHPNGNVDPYIQYWKKSPDTYKLEAYNADGKFLWRYDMGWAIEQGIWYSPYIVYDFDGDGRAEVACKAGEGDPRDVDGRVQTGPEYLAILEGTTGKLLSRIDWPSREGFEDYNRYSRNQLGLAYLDGKKPSLIVERGTYSTIKVHAYELAGGKLREVWQWHDRQEAGGGYRGQGAHCLRAADVDNDGRDEVILGSAVLDDNGRGLWTTRLGHPDHVYVGDLDPARPGLEIYYGMETKQQRNGVCMVEAATGKILWGYDQPTRHVHSQGLCADIIPDHPGVECYSADTDSEKKFAYGLLHDARGKLIARPNLSGFGPLSAYWDADPQRELLMNNKLTKFGGQDVFTGLSGSVVGVADILGDWREEIIAAVPGELRIYTTTIPAADRRICLLQDPIYRNDVATASQGYYQVPTPKVLPGTEL